MGKCVLGIVFKAKQTLYKLVTHKSAITKWWIEKYEWLVDLRMVEKKVISIPGDEDQSS